MVDTMQWVSAVLAFVALALAAGVLVARFAPRSSPLAARVTASLAGLRAPLTFGVAAVATAGSLYFSERAGYVPCRLCWFQRIAMYPIAAVSLVGLVRRDAGMRWYVLPLAIVGAAISAYHVMIEQGWINDSESCALFGPSCADVWFEAFGFMTLALMALAGFVSIIVFNTVSFATVDSEETL